MHLLLGPPAFQTTRQVGYHGIQAPGAQGLVVLSERLCVQDPVCPPAGLPAIVAELKNPAAYATKSRVDVANAPMSMHHV